MMDDHGVTGMEKFESLVPYLELRAQTQPDDCGYTFLVDGTTPGDTLTYGQLDLQSREIAVMLRRVLKPGDRALLMYPPGLDFVSAFFGCLYAGVIAVPAYPPPSARPERSLPRLRSIAVEAGISAILCNEEVSWKFCQLFRDTPELFSIPLLATDHYGLESVEGWQAPDCDPDSIAFLQYTSGSTAAPKGVAVSHGNILHNLAYIHEGSKYDHETTLVSWLPTYHDMGLFAGVLFPLFKGCPSYLMSPVSFLQQPIRWLQAISQYGGTNSGGPDFAYDLCVQRTKVKQRRELDLSTWRIAYNGAEPIRQSTLDRFSVAFEACGFRREALYPVYGLAESTVFVSGQRLSGKIQTNHASSDHSNTDRTASSGYDKRPIAGRVSCGVPGFGMEVVIADPHRLVEMPEGEIGEIWIRGASVAKGYWNRPLETAQKFCAFLADTNLGPYLRTGDLGLLRNGELFVTGRIKDLIIVRGRKHYPQDIEQTIEASHHELRIKSSAAISLPTDEGEQLGIVAEVNRRHDSRRRPGSSGETECCRDPLNDIIATIRQAVAEQHELQAAAIFLLSRGSLPKTSSGKIRRHACCEAVMSGTLESLAEWTLHPIAFADRDRATENSTVSLV